MISTVYAQIFSVAPSSIFCLLVHLLSPAIISFNAQQQNRSLELLPPLQVATSGWDQIKMKAHCIKQGKLVTKW